MTYRLSLIALGAALTGPASLGAHAQAYWDEPSAGYAGAPVAGCEAARRDNQLAGAVIGGVLGGVAGGLIVDGDDGHYVHRRHGFRGHRGFYGRKGFYRHRGFYGHRGFHGHRGGRYYRSGNGDEVAGVVLGAIVGGIAGSELGKNAVDCDTTWRYSDVPPPTRSASGPAWEGPAYTVSSRDIGVVRDVFEPDLYGGQDETLRECETVYRETEFPDGRIVREPVQACRDGEVIYEPRARFDEWRVAPECGLQTRDPNCIG